MKLQSEVGKALEKYLVPFLAVLLVGTIIGISAVTGPGGDPVWIQYNSSESADAQQSEEGTSGEDSSVSGQSPSSGKPSSSGRAGASSQGGRGSSSFKNKSSSKPGNPSNGKGGADSPEPGESGDSSAGDPEPLEPDDSNLPYNTVGNTAGNLLNGGLCCEQGEWVYYVNSQDGSALYKMRRDGSEQTKLSDFSVGSINVLGEQVFVQRTDARAKIGVMQIDGSPLREIQFQSYSLCATQSGLISGNGPDESCIGKLGNDYRSRCYLFEEYSASAISVHSGRVYFINQSDDNRLYSMDENGGGLSTETDVSVTAYGFDGDTLLYCCGGVLYREGSALALYGAVGTFNVREGKVYYTDLDNGERLCRMNADGGSPQVISDRAVSEVCLSGGWIFYRSGGTVYQQKE